MHGKIKWREEVKGIIAVQLYNLRSCRSIIAHSRSVNAWVAAPVAEQERDGSSNSTIRPEYRSASALAPDSRSPLRREFDRRMNLVVKPLVHQVWNVGIRKHMATHITRYVAGDFYATHSDVTLESNYRYFTVLCYLNDDFQGGQTSFPHLNYSVTPQTGKAVIFPSTYLHRAVPIISGEKYVIVSWLTGPPPIQWI